MRSFCAHLERAKRPTDGLMDVLLFWEKKNPPFRQKWIKNRLQGVQPPAALFWRWWWWWWWWWWWNFLPPSIFDFLFCLNAKFYVTFKNGLKSCAAKPQRELLTIYGFWKKYYVDFCVFEKINWKIMVISVVSEKKKPLQGVQPPAALFMGDDDDDRFDPLRFSIFYSL